MNLINWITFFDSRHDNDQGNYDSSVFSEAWSHQTTPNKKALFITNDAHSIVLAANANKTVAVLHSFKNIGGTPLHPANKYACFCGTSNNATVVIINMILITSNIASRILTSMP